MKKKLFCMLASVVLFAQSVSAEYSQKTAYDLAFASALLSVGSFVGAGVLHKKARLKRLRNILYIIGALSGTAAIGSGFACRRNGESVLKPASVSTPASAPTPTPAPIPTPTPTLTPTPTPASAGAGAGSEFDEELVSNRQSAYADLSTLLHHKGSIIGSVSGAGRAKSLGTGERWSSQIAAFSNLSSLLGDKSVEKHCFKSDSSRIKDAIKVCAYVREQFFTDDNMRHIDFLTDVCSTLKVFLKTNKNEYEKIKGSNIKPWEYICTALLELKYIMNELYRLRKINTLRSVGDKYCKLYDELEATVLPEADNRARDLKNFMEFRYLLPKVSNEENILTIGKLRALVGPAGVIPATATAAAGAGGGKEGVLPCQDVQDEMKKRYEELKTSINKRLGSLDSGSRIDFGRPGGTWGEQVEAARKMRQYVNMYYTAFIRSEIGNVTLVKGNIFELVYQFVLSSFLHSKKNHDRIDHGHINFLIRSVESMQYFFRLPQRSSTGHSISSIQQATTRNCYPWHITAGAFKALTLIVQKLSANSFDDDATFVGTKYLALYDQFKECDGYFNWKWLSNCKYVLSDEEISSLREQIAPLHK